MNRLTTTIKKTLSLCKAACRMTHASCSYFILRHATALMFILGVGILSTVLTEISTAQVETNISTDVGVEQGDERSVKWIEKLDTESRIMLVSGFAAIVCAAFGAYRLAVGLLVVAVVSFVLRDVLYYDDLMYWGPD